MPHSIDPTHPANRDPSAAADAQLADEIEGRPLQDPALGMDFSGNCRRCETKNKRRRAYGVDTREPWIADGERVLFNAHWVREADGGGGIGGYWRVATVYHADHPQPPFEEIEQRGRRQIRGRANLEWDGQVHRLRNVSVEERSRPPQGVERPPVVERENRHRGEDGTVAVPADEPEPGWPEAEREWLEDLLSEHAREEDPHAR